MTTATTRAEVELGYVKWGAVGGLRGPEGREGGREGGGVEKRRGQEGGEGMEDQWRGRGRGELTDSQGKKIWTPWQERVLCVCIGRVHRIHVSSV